MTKDDDPYRTIEKLLPAAKQEGFSRGTTDPIWDLIDRAEAMLSGSMIEERTVATTIADWMTVRFGGLA
jgi:hypothetical protein